MTDGAAGCVLVSFVAKMPERGPYISPKLQIKFL